MRIGVDIRGLLTGKISGVEQYTLQILRHLLEIDKTNTYVLFYVDYKNYNQIFAQLLEDYPFLRQANVSTQTLKWPDLPLLMHMVFKTLNLPLIDKVCGGLDVMFMPSPRLLPLSRDCAKVTTVHDLIFMIHPEFFTLTSRLWQWQMSYGYEIRTSDLAISVSDNTKKDIMRFTLAQPGRVRVVLEGVGEECFVDQTSVLNELRKKFELPQQYIYFVGSLEPRKNLGTLIHALKDLNSLGNDTIKLVISGQKSWMFESVKELIAQLDLTDRIIFTGPVSEAEKIALLGGASVFVFPSVYEGFGLMILEAFATKTPVIISDSSSLPEVADDAAIAVPIYDHQAMAESIHRVVTDVSLRKNMIERGLRRAHQLTWQKAAKETLQILNEAVELHNGNKK
jgi:glycosyltransferase involved in cell wall biosynthesis